MKWVLLIIVMGFNSAEVEKVEFPTEGACNAARDDILGDGDYSPRAHKWQIGPTSLRVYCFRRYGSGE